VEITHAEDEMDVDLPAQQNVVPAAVITRPLTPAPRTTSPVATPHPVVSPTVRSPSTKPIRPLQSQISGIFGGKSGFFKSVHDRRATSASQRQNSSGPSAGGSQGSSSPARFLPSADNSTNVVSASSFSQTLTSPRRSPFVQSSLVRLSSTGHASSGPERGVGMEDVSSTSPNAALPGTPDTSVDSPVTIPDGGTHELPPLSEVSTTNSSTPSPQMNASPAANLPLLLSLIQPRVASDPLHLSPKVVSLASVQVTSSSTTSLSGDRALGTTLASAQSGPPRQPPEVIDLTLSDSENEVSGTRVWSDGEDKLADTTELLETLQPGIFGEVHNTQTKASLRRFPIF
jgi:hypothetical protein